MKCKPMNECHANFTSTNLYVKCVFNPQYQCVKRTNYEWTNFAQFSLLRLEMLNLWSRLTSSFLSS